MQNKTKQKTISKYHSVCVRRKCGMSSLDCKRKTAYDSFPNLQPFPKRTPKPLPQIHSKSPRAYLKSRDGDLQKRSETNEIFFCFANGRCVYFSFFLGRSWLVCPHFFLRQLVALGGRRAFIRGALLVGIPERKRGRSNAHSIYDRSSSRSCTWRQEPSKRAQ